MKAVLQKVEELTGERAGNRAVRKNDIKFGSGKMKSVEIPTGGSVTVKDYNALRADIAVLYEMLRRASA